MNNLLLLTWFTMDLSPARVLCMKHMKVDLKFPTIWNISLSILLQKIPANCVNLSSPEHRMMQFWLDIYFISDSNDLGLLFLFESVKTPGPRLNIKTVLSTYGDFHVLSLTWELPYLVRPSFLLRRPPVYWNWELHRQLKAIPIAPKKLQVQSNTYQ